MRTKKIATNILVTLLCTSCGTTSPVSSNTVPSASATNSVASEGVAFDMFGNMIVDADGNAKDVDPIAFNEQMRLQALEGSSSLFEPYLSHPVGSWPEALAVADFTGDGRNDVAVGTSTYSDPVNDKKIHIFVQDSAGNLSRREIYANGPSNVRGMTSGDFNGDKRADIATASSGGSSSTQGYVRVLLQNSNGSFLPGIDSIAGTGTDSVKACDLNIDADSLEDAVASNWNSNFLSIFYQDPATQLLSSQEQYIVPAAGYDEMECGDVNGDGRDDIVFMRGQLGIKRLVVALQRSGGGFALPAEYVDGVGWQGSAHAVALGDVNGDGRKDVVLGLGGNVPNAWVGLLLQNSSGTLNAPKLIPAYHIPEAVEVRDINLDGRDDIVVAHSGWNKVSVYAQDACGALKPYELFSVPYASHYKPQGLMAEDVTSDGIPDIELALSTSNGSLVTLRGTGARDKLPPTVVSSSPADGAVDVLLHTALTITMTESVAPCSKVEFFAQHQGMMATKLVGRLTIAGNRATLDQISPAFKPNQQVTITVSGAMDIDGNKMAPKSFGFVTGTGIQPVLLE